MIAILFVYFDSFFYLRVYFEILFFDYMYKINKYGMSFFDIIGVDTTGRSFCITFVFLNDEAEKDYMWAFKRLKILYE